jgi:hypothetical protein
VGQVLGLHRRDMKNEGIRRDVVVVEEEVARSGYCMFAGCPGGRFLGGRGRIEVGGRDRYYSILLADSIQFKGR